MDLNKKGQEGTFFMFMIGIVIIILAFALSPSLTKTSNDSRTNMDCNNATLENYQKVQCTIVDITSPSFIWVLIGLGAISFTAKVVLG